MDGTQQPSNSGEVKPGDTISPQVAQPQAAAPAPNPVAAPAPTSIVQTPVVTPAPAPAPIVIEPEQFAPTLPQIQSQPEYAFPNSVASPPTGPEGAISWTASEFVAHHKSSGWYVSLGIAALVITALVWLFTKDVISSIFILIAALLFGIFATRQPRDLGYRLDQSGLTIGNKHFTYGMFRSFAVMQEGAFSSIVFVPLKRFALLTTIYYDPADEPKIVDLLSERLPLEERSHDVVDRLMWRIRF